MDCKLKRQSHYLKLPIYDSKVLEKYEHLNNTLSRKKVVQNCIHRLNSKRKLCIHLSFCQYGKRKTSKSEVSIVKSRRSSDSSVKLNETDSFQKRRLYTLENEYKKFNYVLNGNQYLKYKYKDLIKDNKVLSDSDRIIDFTQEYNYNGTTDIDECDDEQVYKNVEVCNYEESNSFEKECYDCESNDYKCSHNENNHEEINTYNYESRSYESDNYKDEYQKLDITDGNKLFEEYEYLGDEKGSDERTDKNQEKKFIDYYKSGNHTERCSYQNNENNLAMEFENDRRENKNIDKEFGIEIRNINNEDTFVMGTSSNNIFSGKNKYVQEKNSIQTTKGFTDIEKINFRKKSNDDSKVCIKIQRNDYEENKDFVREFHKNENGNCVQEYDQEKNYKCENKYYPINNLYTAMVINNYYQECVRYNIVTHETKFHEFQTAQRDNVMKNNDGYSKYSNHNILDSICNFEEIIDYFDTSAEKYNVIRKIDYNRDFVVENDVYHTQKSFQTYSDTLNNTNDVCVHKGTENNCSPDNIIINQYNEINENLSTKNEILIIDNHEPNMLKIDDFSDLYEKHYNENEHFNNYQKTFQNYEKYNEKESNCNKRYDDFERPRGTHQKSSKDGSEYEFRSSFLFKSLFSPKEVRLINNSCIPNRSLDPQSNFKNIWMRIKSKLFPFYGKENISSNLQNYRKIEDQKVMGTVQRLIFNYVFQIYNFLKRSFSLYGTHIINFGHEERNYGSKMCSSDYYLYRICKKKY